MIVSQLSSKRCTVRSGSRAGLLRPGPLRTGLETRLRALGLIRLFGGALGLDCAIGVTCTDREAAHPVLVAQA